jgi:outer membrane protein assembly factor BamB
MVKANPIAGAILLGAALLVALPSPWSFPLTSQVARPSALRPAGAQGTDAKTDDPENDLEQPAPRAEPSLALPTDPSAQRKLKAAQEYINRESWDQATRVLQSLLDGPDAFLRVRGTGADGKEIAHWTPLHLEADRLLGTLPASGRQFYELMQGSRAKALLIEAKEQADPHLLAEVSRRYLHTVAGAEATGLLGVHHLDRGHPALAAACLARRLGLADAGKLPPALVWTAAVAFQRAGDNARVLQAWQQLAARAPEGLRIRGKATSLADLQAWLAKDRAPARASSAALEWPLFRGNAARSARADGADLVPEAKWHLATVHETATRTWVQEAIRRQEARGEPVLPGFFPIAADGKVVYRSYRGIHAVDARTGQRFWESESLGGLDPLGLELSYFPYVESWVNVYLQHDPEVLFGNAVLGALSTDGERVYAVDDLAIPPYQNTYFHRGRPIAAVEYSFAPGLTEAAHHSRLLALDLKSGKIVWERGGPGSPKKSDGLYPCYFLGPPLPVGWRLYGLIEKDQELQLVCLDATGGKALWVMPLGLAPDRLLRQPTRRVQAAHLACAEGVLVCPTNAGLVLGVDLVGRCVLWAYSYREAVRVAEADFPPGGRGGRGRAMPTAVSPRLPRPSWAAPAPLVADGRVIFTAPDGPSVHCLSLREGTLLWKASRADDDLYVAGVSLGKVLLVGKQACRALDLADGKPLWEAATGLPSGLGVMGDAVYYLPLKATTKDKQPAVCAIDVDSGHLRAHFGLGGNETPGNLLFYEGAVLSQTATALTAYPQEVECRGP